MRVQFEWSERTPPGVDRSEIPVYRITLKAISRLGRGKRAVLWREGRRWFAEQTGREADEDFDNLTDDETDLLNAVFERATMLATYDAVEQKNGDDWQPCAPFWREAIDEFLELPSELWDMWLISAYNANPHLLPLPQDEESKKNGGAKELSYLM